jgi:outer membrane protein TolC
MSRFSATLLSAALVVSLPVPAAAQLRLTLDDAVGEALTGNRSLQSARAATSQAEAAVREARAGFFPRIHLAEAWRRGDQPVFVFSSLLSSRRFAASNFAIDALNHPDPVGFFQTAVGVEQVLFDGGRARAALQAASLQRDMSRYDVDEAAAGVRVTVTQTYGRILTAQAAKRAADTGLAAARSDLARLEARRDAGMATEADVLSLRVHVGDLERRAIQADGDAAIARAELNRLLGAPVDRDFDAVEPADVAGTAATTPRIVELTARAESARPALRRAVAAEAVTRELERQARAGLVPQVAAQASVDVSGTRPADRASSWIVGGEVRWTWSTGGAETARVRAASAAAARARLDREDARAAVQVEILSAAQRLAAARARQAVGAAAVEQARESQRIIRDRFEAGITGVADVLRASATMLDAEADRTAALVDALVSQAMLGAALGEAATTAAR